jgi:hypothetical protein
MVGLNSRMDELRAYCPNRLSTGAARCQVTALESGRVRAALVVRPLYLETGHWRADFLTDRLTGNGRDLLDVGQPLGRLSAVPRSCSFRR